VQRKVVTILFCDVVGSTALGETTDPEALRALLARYFERMKEVVERHGGTVEKFIGDAVMAVFGVPVAHEDDALRACRAAAEMRESFPDLGVDGRIGVTTGEVVVGTEERLATGDAVNMAARLQQAAQPGEVLVDEATVELVRQALDVEPLEPLELKGKTQPVVAHRLLGLHDVAERRHDTRFVGRERELAEVREAWSRALTGQSCELFTIVGEAGVGKSRLVAEALGGMDVPVVYGRCLPYGEGITYWPVVEAIKQLGALPSDTAAAAAIRSLLGESGESTSAEEIAWAFRKLLEEQAPAVAVFDDIQWGEETFLDLLEHLALLSAGAPLLLLCMARKELVDRRPTWPVSVGLEPLGDDDVAELIGDELPSELRDRIAAAAGGNPLFVAEMLAMAGEADDDVPVPPTLRALLAARLDQLESDDRAVLERAAVEGEIFHRGAIQALSGDGPVTPRLASLVRKGLIWPDLAQIPGDDAFRFRHLLIRDAAYHGLPKAARSELHERLAAWLDERAPGLVELDELVGYHLERAVRYKQELGQPDPALAARAGDRLAIAGRRALEREDGSASKALLQRALELTRPLRFDVHLELDLVENLGLTDSEAAAESARATARRARERGNPTGEAAARVKAAFFGFLAKGSGMEEAEAAAEDALPRLENAGDDAALSEVWEALSVVVGWAGRWEESARAAERAIHHAKASGRPYALLSAALGHALSLGPRPADEALQALEAALPDGSLAVRPAIERAWLLAMLGRFDEAWPLAEEADERDRELSGLRGWGLGELAECAGDHVAAADYYGRYCRRLEAYGHHGWLSTYAPKWGRELCLLGRCDEAEPLARLGRELGDRHDVETQALWRQTKALVCSHRGDHRQAEAFVRAAVAISEQTDGLNLQAKALCDLGEVVSAAGRASESVVAFEQALEKYERKRNLALAAQVRARLAGEES
jgi:class 3 adenylate cyclase/tetratricopeptide (TPR) repeat protein